MYNDEPSKKDLFKIGVGVFLKASEYVAEVGKNPEAIQTTRSLADAVSKFDNVGKVGVKVVEWTVKGAGAVGITGVAINGTAAGGTISAAAVAAAPFLPAIAVVAGSGLAICVLIEALDQ